MDEALWEMSKWAVVYSEKLMGADEYKSTLPLPQLREVQLSAKAPGGDSSPHACVGSHLIHRIVLWNYLPP